MSFFIYIVLVGKQMQFKTVMSVVVLERKLVLFKLVLVWFNKPKECAQSVMEKVFVKSSFLYLFDYAFSDQL